MSGISRLASPFIGIWKVVAMVLLAVVLMLLVVTGGAGVGWWRAATACDQALAALTAEQGANAALRAGAALQNARIVALDQQTRAAEARGRAARQLAAARVLHLDTALTTLAGARATTCQQAMPAVNRLLETVR